MKQDKLSVGFLLGAASNEGGIARVTSIIAEQLQNNPQYNIHIISYVNTKSNGYGWSSSLKFHSLFQDRKPLKKRIFSGAYKLNRIITQNNIEILVSCGALFGPLGLLGTMLSKTKHIYWDHSNFFQDGDHRFELQGKKITARFADAVVPLTKTDEKNYSEHSAAKRIIQIYNPIDIQLFDNPKAYNNKAKRIISVGRLGYQKNFLGLVDVAKEVLKAHPEWEWHIFGKGDEERSIKDKIRNEGIQNNLILKGHSSNLYEGYNDYAFLVMTSRYEGFPMSLLEGMAKGLPLISYDILTGPNEIIKEESNGFLISFEDKKGMAQKIITLIENQELRQKMSHNQVALLNEFKLEKIIGQWQQLFESI